MSEWFRLDDPTTPPPDFDRVIVAGWQKPMGGTAGYWWYHEDDMFRGKPCQNPDATHWTPLVLPPFPEPPK